MTEASSQDELGGETARVTGCSDGCCAPRQVVAAAGATRVGPGPRRRAVLSRRIRLLVAATITYNVIEAIVAIAAGGAASSTALIGFGLDSTIEVSSAAAVAWQFSARQVAVRQARERTALRIIAVSFFALAGYVSVEAVRPLAGGAGAEESEVGIVLAALSVMIMPGLSLAQRHTGRELGSASAVADSKQTLLCTYLSGALLIGLVLNTAFGWSWADPIVALIIAAVAVREGRETWRGDGCCAPTTALVGDHPPECEDRCDHHEGKPCLFRRGVAAVPPQQQRPLTSRACCCYGACAASSSPPDGYRGAAGNWR